MIDKQTNFRLIIDEQHSAKENMARDEALLKNFKQDDDAILRFYTWDENSISLGASQQVSDFDFGVGQENIAKRITGGGVLFHGHDVSYSITIPSYILEGLNIKQSYEKICQFIFNFYKDLGLDVKFAKDKPSIELSKSSFCQVGFEAYDMIINGVKIGGNAQKRTKKVIFQHGSIPAFTTKDKLKQGNSLQDIGIDISYENIIDGLIKSFQKSFNVKLITSKINDEENKLKEELLKGKYDYN